jgi:acyl-CoA thioesterase
MTVTTMTPLSSVLALQPSDGGFITELPTDWGQGRTTFGGLIAAIALRALHWHVAEGRPVRSFLMDCMAPAVPGTLQIAIEVLRVGKSLLHARDALARGDRTRRRTRDLRQSPRVGARHGR